LSVPNVYFAEAHVPIEYIPRVPSTKWYTHSLIYQTKELAGKMLSDIIKPRDSVAVKIHFGERYSQYYIRPAYVRKVVDKIKELGGQPFVCDTLFSGSKVLRDDAGEPFLTRRSLKEGLETAAMNGFTNETMDCPVIFADAHEGFHSIERSFSGKYIKKVYIAPAIAEANVLLSLAHFKCHDCMAVGGTLKNIGVGCSSKQGKWWIHHSSKLSVDKSKCTGCKECISVCPVSAIEMRQEKATIIADKCIDCATCVDYCKPAAFASKTFPTIEEQEARIAETAAGIIEHFNEKTVFVNLAIDIAPLCDCDPYQGVPIVPNLGVLASKDPVALDRACIDIANASPGIPGSMAESAQVLLPGTEKINALAKMRWNATPGAENVAPDWRVMLTAAENAELGTQSYKLIKVNFGYSANKK
jgi:hypothetical protein